MNQEILPGAIPEEDSSEAADSSPDEIISTEPSRDQKALISAADRRISRGIWILGLAGTLAALLLGGWKWAGGFVSGSIVSAVNFHWMKRAISRVTDLAASQGSPPTEGAPARRPSSLGTVIRFVLRYALIGVTSYAILKGHFFSLGAFFVGLFLFLAAIMAELAYEIYRGFRNTT